MTQTDVNLVDMEVPPATFEPADQVSATLVKPHTHSRKQYVAGDIIKITAAQRSWLQSLGVVAGDNQEM